MPPAAAHVPEQHQNHVSPKTRAVVVPQLIINSAVPTLQLPSTMVAPLRIITAGVLRCKCRHLHGTLPGLHHRRTPLLLILPTSVIITCPRHHPTPTPSFPEQDATGSISKNHSISPNASRLSASTRASPRETTPVQSTRQTYRPYRVQWNTTPRPTSRHQVSKI